MWNSRVLRRANYLHSVFDAGLIIASLYLSLSARLGWDTAISSMSTLNALLPLFVLLRIATFLGMGVYDIKWRYVSAKDSVTILRAILLSSALIISTTYLVDIGRLPRSIFFIDAAFLTLLMAGTRLLRRIAFEYSTHRELGGKGRVTLVYGAGVGGRALAHRIVTDPTLGLHLAGFVDDNRIEVGRTIYGKKVLGTSAELPYLLSRLAVQELIVAFSDVSPSKLQELIFVTKKANVKLRRLTDFTGGHSVQASGLFRNIELGDLLGRQQKKVDLSAAAPLIRGKKVLITGAGGSIGSELSRQVASFRPHTLVLLDHSEYNLYAIDHELRADSSRGTAIVPALVDVKDREALGRVFDEHQPDVVFHAAAYKHVQLVELNSCTAVLNNIEGTRAVLDLSVKNNVGTFVMISTDKAVNPVGVMGATKRVCELLVQATGEQTGRRFCSVRFGNVLGSSGSLIPLLQKQISAGESLTITHPDMTRYFMLIPEAVSLVLRAATIANPGDVQILDMGEPVKIVDIASSLRALMGRTEIENPIIFTGIRPGEKMYEELYLCGNEVLTQDPNIFVLPAGDGATGFGGRETGLGQEVEKIIAMAQDGSPAVATELLSFVNQYGRRSMASDGLAA